MRRIFSLRQAQDRPWVPVRIICTSLASLNSRSVSVSRCSRGTTIRTSLRVLCFVSFFSPLFFVVLSRFKLVLFLICLALLFLLRRPHFVTGGFLWEGCARVSLAPTVRERIADGRLGVQTIWNVVNATYNTLHVPSYCYYC